MAALRVTNSQTTDVLIQQIFERRIALEDVRQSIATGLKIDTASDDPGKSGTILNLQATKARVERHKERIGFATSILNHQEATLSTADDVLVRAREIATQAANGSLSWEDRRLLSDEVFQLRDQLVSLGNTTFQGQYVYGGIDDDDAPFDQQQYAEPPALVPLATSEPAHFGYLHDNAPGSTATRSIQITDQSTLRIQTPGAQVFQDAISGMERLGRALAGYRTPLNAGTGLPIFPGTATGNAYTQPTDYAEQTHDILDAMDDIEEARVNDIVVERSDLGARISRLEQVSEILDNLKAGTESSRSVLQDADLFEASAKFSNLQNSLQALLASGARINDLSLLNFI